MRVEKMRDAFQQRFGGVPSVIVRAPGRVNLIGEHTDYNQGFVMPLAIDRAAWIAARARDDNQVVLASENFQQREQFSLDHIERVAGEGAWSNYTRGVAYILKDVGHRLYGMDAVIWGDVPMGAGLSSSAALEVASALAFVEISGLSIRPLDIALLSQRAEIEFVGVNVGIMDPMISALGQEGHALLIDCRTFDYRAVPIPREVAIVIADTMKRRGLVDSKYNERRRECEEGARRLGVKSLRDLTLEEFECTQSILPDVIHRRCRHVISENERVLRCADFLQAGNLHEVGELLKQSHVSLRDDYGVSCKELDLMVDLALQQSVVYGARMTGAGFGGCTVNLVAREHVVEFSKQLAERYQYEMGVTPSIYASRARAGAQVSNEIHTKRIARSP